MIQSKNINTATQKGEKIGHRNSNNGQKHKKAKENKQTQPSRNGKKTKYRCDEPVENRKRYHPAAFKHIGAY